MQDFKPYEPGAPLAPRSAQNFPVFEVNGRQVALVPIDDLTSSIARAVKQETTLATPVPARQPEPEARSVAPLALADPNVLSLLTGVCWVAAIVTVAYCFYLVFGSQRQPAPVVVAPAQPQVERRPFEERTCRASGFLGLNQDCNERRWWE